MSDPQVPPAPPPPGETATEGMTPEEHARTLVACIAATGAGDDPKLWQVNIACEIREAEARGRRAGLEAAAKASCEGCRANWTRDGEYHRLPQPEGVFRWQRCAALDVLALLEDGTAGEGGGVEG